MSDENRMVTNEWLYANLLPFKKVQNPPNDKRAVKKEVVTTNYNVDESKIIGYVNNQLIPRGKCVGVNNEIFTSRFLGGDLVYGSVQQHDGKVIVYGNYTTYNNIDNRISILRLNKDLMFDNTFKTETVFTYNTYNTVTLQNDGSVIYAGEFSSFRGTPCNKIVRLDQNGNIDNDFINNTNISLSSVTRIYKVLIKQDGRIIVACLINSSPEASKNRHYCIMCLNNNGTINTSYTIYYHKGQVRDMCTYDNNKLAVVGDINGDDLYIPYSDRKVGFMCFEDNGNIDSSVNIGTGFSYVSGQYITTPKYIQFINNSFYITGTLVKYKDTPCNLFIKINKNGNIDNTFNNTPIEPNVSTSHCFYYDNEDNTFIYCNRDKLIITDVNGNPIFNSDKQVIARSIHKIETNKYIISGWLPSIDNKQGIQIYDKSTNTYS